jgi:hypothetical protein
MNRQLTALFAAFEALLVVGIGVGIPLLPLTILWGAQFGFALDWAVFWRATADIWLIGHGVDVRFTLDAATAAGLGFTGAGEPFTVSIAALGVALLTIVLGLRAGRRIAETGHLLLGGIVAVVVFAGLSLLIAWSALHPLARPSLTQSAILPALVFGVGLAIGMLRESRVAGPPVLRQLPDSARVFLGAALRGGAGAAALVVLAASVVTALAVLVSYARIITLYEGLHTEVLGGVIVTLGQLAFIPNLVLWSASWFVGPGFALGTGSVVGPVGTQLGPVPAIPVLGALPVGDVPFGMLALLVPVIAGFLVGAVAGPRVRDRVTGVPLLLIGPAIGVVGGLTLGLLAGASAGSAGPGRLIDVGPDPVAVGIFATLEIAVAASVGLFASLRRRAPERVRAPR